MSNDTVPRTYILPWGLVDRIDAQAAKQSAFQSHIVIMLLERALDEVEAGRWRLDKEATYFKPVWRS